HYYMGGVLAELLRREGFRVSLVTPAPLVSIFAQKTLEQELIQARLIELDVGIHANLAVSSIAADQVRLACVFTGREMPLACDATVLVTARDPRDQLFHALAARGVAVSRTGDCFGPGTIAAAVHAGRRFAEEFGDQPRDFTELPFRREVTELA
ncbi:MAG: NADH:flavin oxidoreductase, partial [Rhizobiales bacterium]|nr:NADH:flavin oxidoreductase [Hyphomicrobiales bacterium]